MQDRHDEILDEYVFGVFVNKKAQVLTVQSYATQESDIFLWNFPGGKVEEGRTKEDSLRRILFRNFNVDVDIIKRVTIKDYLPLQGFKKNQFKKRRMHLYYVVPLEGQTLERRRYKRMVWKMLYRLDEMNWHPATAILVNDSLRCVHKHMIGKF